MITGKKVINDKEILRLIKDNGNCITSVSSCYNCIFYSQKALCLANRKEQGIYHRNKYRYEHAVKYYVAKHGKGSLMEELI